MSATPSPRRRRVALSPTTTRTESSVSENNSTRNTLIGVMGVLAVVALVAVASFNAGQAQNMMETLGKKNSYPSTPSTPTYSSPTYSAPSYSTPTYSTPTYSTPTYSSPTYSSPVDKCLYVKCGACEKCDSYSGTCVADNGQDNQVCGGTYDANSCGAPSKCYAGKCVASYAQDGTACGSYDTTNKCAAPSACYGGKCVAAYAQDGTSCGYDDECNSYSCYAGTCKKTVKVDATCGAAPSDYCTLPGKCSYEGKCVSSFREQGTQCRASSPDACTKFECNGYGSCAAVNKPKGTECGSTYTDAECGFVNTCDGYGVCKSYFPTDGQDCGYDDECNDFTCYRGQCKKQVLENAPCGDAPTDECTLPGYCNAQGECYQAEKEDDTPCGYNDEACFFNTCQSGKCTTYQQPEGYKCGDGNGYGYDSDCAVPDRCDAYGQCVPSYDDSDGNDCGYAAECQYNQCYHGKCQSNPIPDSEYAPCSDDYNSCTKDVCVGGYCAHPPVAEMTPCRDDAMYNGCVNQYCSYGTCVTKDSGKCNGCTPGYWRQSQHSCNWRAFKPTDSFSKVFGVTLSGYSGLTLQDALNLGGGGQQAMARHATAALLTAQFVSQSSSFKFYYDVAGVKAVVKQYWNNNVEAGKDLLAAQNERGSCPLANCK